MPSPRIDEKSPAQATNKTAVEILSPAKINIFLKITKKRPDGYHELITVFVPIALYDTLSIGTLDKGLEVHGSGRELPTGENNLIHRAASSFLQKTGITKGVKITVIKRIPISSGLGGGSSNAASTLKGLNRLWSNPLSKEDLEKLALSLGADVPFFLLRKPAVARGIGEILEPIEHFPSWWYVIISPHLMISTAWVFKEMNLKLTTNGKEDMIKSFRNGAFDIQEVLFNDLEAVTLKKHPFLKSIKDSLLHVGALGTLMTGSGPSIFGLFNSAEKAREAGKILRSYGKGDVFVAKGLA